MSAEAAIVWGPGVDDQSEDQTMTSFAQYLQSRTDHDFETFWGAVIQEYQDDYDAEPPEERGTRRAPNDISKQCAWHVLSRLHREPSAIIPSASGGIAICFSNGDKYADIECLNSGSVVGVTSNRRGSIRAFQLERLSADEVDHAISRVLRFVGLPALQDAAD